MVSFWNEGVDTPCTYSQQQWCCVLDSNLIKLREAFDGNKFLVDQIMRRLIWEQSFMLQASTFDRRPQITRTHIWPTEVVFLICFFSCLRILVHKTFKLNSQLAKKADKLQKG
jgi:hypothetical protein